MKKLASIRSIPAETSTTKWWSRKKYHKQFLSSWKPKVLHYFTLYTPWSIPTAEGIDNTIHDCPFSFQRKRTSRVLATASSCKKSLAVVCKNKAGRQKWISGRENRAAQKGIRWGGMCGQKSHYPPGTTMLSTSKNVLFPGHNHLLTTGADDQILWLLPECMIAICLVQCMYMYAIQKPSNCETHHEIPDGSPNTLYNWVLKDRN